MSVRNLFLFCVPALLIAQPLHAQSEARIRVIQPSINHLKEDIKFLVELSPTPVLKKQWDKTLDPLIDSFAEGLDPTKPMRVDLVFGKADIGYELHFPLMKLKKLNKLDKVNGFLENLDGFGYKSKELAPGLFELTQGAKKNLKIVGFLREANKYASIAPTQAAVPANLSHPITKDLQAYLAKGYDVAAELKNDPNDKAGMAARLANFKELRKQLEAGITFKRDEDKSTFELRKLSLVQNLNEAERFLVETELATINWVTDIAAKTGRGELTFTAIPDTALRASAELLAAKPSYFANVKAPAKSGATGRLNFPIDTLRAGHLKDFYKVFRPVLAKRLDGLASLKEADQKAAAKQVGDLIIDMLDAGLAISIVDGIIDLTEADGDKHTLVFGIRAADGKVADQIVSLFPKIWPGFEIKLNVAEVAGASLHTLTLPAKRLPRFQKFFPGETLIHMATSKDAVWIAIGSNAQAELTAAINAVAGPAPAMADPIVASFSANMSKLVALVEAMEPEPAETTGPKTPAQKQRDKVRNLAEQAVKGCEPRLAMALKRNGDLIEATIDVTECALKFVGTMIADFAKDME